VALLRGELELDLLAGQLLVDGREGVDLVLDVGRLLRVEVDLADFRAVEAVARVLADDLRGVDQILQNGLVDRRQRPEKRGARERGGRGRARSGPGSRQGDMALGPAATYALTLAARHPHTRTHALLPWLLRRHRGGSLRLSGCVSFPLPKPPATACGRRVAAAAAAVAAAGGRCVCFG
jgi:hypothetical protein